MIILGMLKLVGASVEIFLFFNSYFFCLFVTWYHSFFSFLLFKLWSFLGSHLLYGKGRGDSEVFLSFFFQEDETSAPDVFSSCSFIPRPNFVKSVTMVTRDDVISTRWSSYFWVKMHVFSISFSNKSKACGWHDADCLFMAYFTCQAQKQNIYRGFNLISNSL